ncbi:MAG: hypothetical protein FJ288_07185 [Planctomycetes bacterium]|nr:hypothetical protein [Planctomycetota bacterium]
MSSRPVPQSADAAAARCLLCNVGCPVRVMRDGPDRYLPDYVPHAGYAGLCARGSILAELLDHPERLVAASRRSGDALAPCDTAAAVAEAAALRDGGPAAVIADGNHDLESIACAARLAAACGGRWAVHLPPGDAGLVASMDSSGCRFIGPEDLAGADALLVIGNVYATHPVAAHWVFEARRLRPRTPVLVMADGCGVTAEFARDVFQPRLAAGEAARAVAAVRTGRTEALGAEGKALAAWKDRLRAGKSPAVVVSAELGYADAAALGAEVAALAKELGASVCPLTTYGNAWGAMRLAAAGKAATVEQVLADPPRTLLVIGADVESALGCAAVAPALAKVSRLIYVGPMPNRMSDQASVVLPAAFAFERAGRALLGPGREVRFGPLLRPPLGVPTVGEVLAGLGGRADAADVSASVPLAAAAAPSAASAAPEGGGLLLAPAGDPFHFADGSLTRRASWPQAVRPRPVLAMRDADAAAAGLAEKSRAVVEGPGGSVEVEVVTSAAQRGGQARASAAFREVRNIFAWNAGGPPPGGPVRVRIRKP